MSIQDWIQYEGGVGGKQKERKERVGVGEGRLEKGKEGGKEKNFLRLHQSKPFICA